MNNQKISCVFKCTVICLNVSFTSIGLAVPLVGVNALETAKDYTDKMVVVK